MKNLSPSAEKEDDSWSVNPFHVDGSDLRSDFKIQENLDDVLFFVTDSDEHNITNTINNRNIITEATK